MTIYLIGIDYRDRRNGPERLRIVLEEIKPDIILREDAEEQRKEKTEYITDTKELFDKKERNTTKRERLIEMLEDLLLPWTDKPIEEYVKASGCEVKWGYRGNRGENYAGDVMDQYGSIRFALITSITLPRNSPYSRRTHLDMYELICEETEDMWKNEWTNTILGLPDEESPKERWDRYTKNEGTWKGAWQMYSKERVDETGTDKNMEQAIRASYDPKKRIAYPVDIQHIVSNCWRKTLYHRIRDLSPRRVSLYER